jgi:succinate dehydrogenase / fumarate reductase cytochrome b subunit
VRYKIQTGSFAWMIQRLTGVVLTLYLFLHLYVLSSLKDPVHYAATLKLMRSLLLRVSDAGLLGLVLGHALNGFRLTLIDLGVPTPVQKRLFYAAFVIGAGIFVACSVPMIRGGQ